MNSTLLGVLSAAGGSSSVLDLDPADFIADLTVYKNTGKATEYKVVFNASAVSGSSTILEIQYTGASGQTAWAQVGAIEGFNCYSMPIDSVTGNLVYFRIKNTDTDQVSSTHRPTLPSLTSRNVLSIADNACFATPTSTEDVPYSQSGTGTRKTYVYEFDANTSPRFGDFPSKNGAIVDISIEEWWTDNGRNPLMIRDGSVNTASPKHLVFNLEPRGGIPYGSGAPKPRSFRVEMRDNYPWNTLSYPLHTRQVMHWVWYVPSDYKRRSIHETVIFQFKNGAAGPAVSCLIGGSDKVHYGQNVTDKLFFKHTYGPTQEQQKRPNFAEHYKPFWDITPGKAIFIHLDIIPASERQKDAGKSPELHFAWGELGTHNYTSEAGRWLVADRDWPNLFDDGDDKTPVCKFGQYAREDGDLDVDTNYNDNFPSELELAYCYSTYITPDHADYLKSKEDLFTQAKCDTIAPAFGGSGSGGSGGAAATWTVTEAPDSGGITRVTDIADLDTIADKIDSRDIRILAGTNTLYTDKQARIIAYKLLASEEVDTRQSTFDLSGSAHAAIAELIDDLLDRDFRFSAPSSYVSLTEDNDYNGFVWQSFKSVDIADALEYVVIELVSSGKLLRIDFTNFEEQVQGALYVSSEVKTAAPSKLEITLNENTTGTAWSAFTVSIAGTDTTPIGGEANEKVLTLYLDRYVQSSQAITVSYDASAGNFQGQTGALNAFTTQATTNSVSCSGHRISSLKLYNADTDALIKEIVEGYEYDLDGAPAITIVAETENCGTTTQSVNFVLSGAASIDRTENGSPWALYGDSSGDFSAWSNPATGDYACTVTPYSGTNKTGTAGQAITVNFKLKNTSTSSVKKLNNTGTSLIPGVSGVALDNSSFFWRSAGMRIMKVTNTNSSGSGSLAAALSATGQRTIIFETSGMINLGFYEMPTNSGQVWIAGQTAPFPGIGIRGSIKFRPSQILCENIAFFGDRPGSNEFDTVTCLGPSTIQEQFFHRCMFLWGLDGTFDITRGNDIGVYYSILAEGRRNDGHPKDTQDRGFPGHAFCTISNPFNPDFHVDFVGNLFAHHQQRQILSRSDTLFAYNYIFNRESRAFQWDNKNEGGGHTTQVVAWRNYINDGPSSQSPSEPFNTAQIKSGSKIHLDNNYWAQKPNDSQTQLVNGWQSSWAASSRQFWGTGLDQAFSVSDVKEMCEDICGPFRGTNSGKGVAPHVSRVITKIKQGKAPVDGSNALLNNPNQVGGFPNIAENPITHNPPSSSADKFTAGASGYTPFEEWVHAFNDEVNA